MLKKLENIALSNKDIERLLNGRVTIVLYTNIHNFNSLDQIIGQYGACALLYQSKKNYGHWTAVIKINDTDCEFFDPYGGNIEGIPDENLKLIPTEFRIQSHQNHTYLIKLMVNSKYQLSYNQYKFQKQSSNIKTCGRHVVFRIMHKHLPLDDYYKYMKGLSEALSLDFDGVVTSFTQ